MGGNALKNTKTGRLDADRYYVLEAEVVSRLKRLLCGLRVETIPAYRQKESFGDMDVLVEASDMIDYMAVVRSFEPNEIVKNGKVISFDYQEFQIDMIVTPALIFDYALTYYSWNDLGNLMGRIYHKLGLKYGHEGLKYTYRTDDGNVLGTVLVTLDIRKTFEFGGYDYDRFLEGFDTLEDMFEYAMSSEYFNPDIFALENRNHRSRVRDAKRPSYTAFLKHVEPLDSSFFYQFDEDKSKYLPLIVSEFPHMGHELESLRAREERRKLIRDKFNGVIVGELTGLSGKELGAFMSSFRESVTDDDLLRMRQDEIDSVIMNAFAART